MKLQHLHESYDVLALLRKAAKQLGLEEPNIWQLTDEGDADHHDAWADVGLAIEIYKQDIEERADSYNDLHTVAQLRLSEEELKQPILALSRLNAGPLGKLGQVQTTIDALSAMMKQVDHLKSSAKNIQSVINLLKQVKRYARAKDIEPSSELSFKVSIARAVLAKLGISYEA